MRFSLLTVEKALLLGLDMGTVRVFGVALPLLKDHIPARIFWIIEDHDRAARAMTKQLMLL